MTFGTSVPGARLTEEDLAVAQQLAGRAAIAVESSNLHATVRGVAERLAHSLLPAELPDVPGWEIEALYRPGSAGQGIEIGGDFYEVFRTEKTTMAVIGDVTGRGVTAATTTPLLRHGARFAGRVEPHPAQILRRLDEELRHGSSTMLCSALCARIERRELVLSSAGHPPALLRAADGTVSEITTAGPLLGAFADARWTQESIQVRPGELVLVYTDGVTETRGSHSRFGLERLKSLLSEVGDRSPAAVLAALELELERYREGVATDDVAALALRPAP
jgi:serine phosphatase RsbU (regulator of sigma subunit)